MKNKTYILGLGILTFSLLSCGNNNDKADGYGNFEATEITISAEAQGKLIQFNLEEGDVLKKEQFIGYIDTIPLALQREQLEVSKALISSKSKGFETGLRILTISSFKADINASTSFNSFRELLCVRSAMIR